jgi:hypothetical protein
VHSCAASTALPHLVDAVWHFAVGQLQAQVVRHPAAAAAALAALVHLGTQHLQQVARVGGLVGGWVGQ